MARHLARSLLLLALTTSLLAACGDDDSGADDSGDEATATTTGGSGDSEMCDLFQQVTDLDDQSQEIVNENLTAVVQATDEEEAQAAFDRFVEAFGPFAEEELPALLEVYDQLADEVPEARRDDVVLLRDFTADFLEDLQDASTPQELAAAVQATRGDAQAAGQATLRLDEISRSECDVVFAD